MSISSDPSQTKPRPTSLAEVREEIDRIDAAMHQLLIERSAVIGDLIAIKKVQPVSPGDDPARRTSAFRPAREASKMRHIIESHTGLLPLDTVESIWRVIISTFTYVQAPYDVTYAQSVDPQAMRDVARFHFGYTVPSHSVDTVSEVLATVGTRGDALGLVPIPGEGAWWQALEAEDAPNVIARLPFVERADHPAGTPCLVLANAPIDEEVMATRVVSVRVAGEPTLPSGADIMARVGDAMLVSADDEAVLEQLVRTPGIDRAVIVGSHAPIFAPVAPT
ncbi:MAG: chorismate mutase [Hyphomicrobiales bacterium]